MALNVLLSNPQTWSVHRIGLVLDRYGLVYVLCGARGPLGVIWDDQVPMSRGT